jgi:hypothetical protein
MDALLSYGDDQDVLLPVNVDLPVQRVSSAPDVEDYRVGVLALSIDLSRMNLSFSRLPASQQKSSTTQKLMRCGGQSKARVLQIKQLGSQQQRRTI